VGRLHPDYPMDAKAGRFKQNVQKQSEEIQTQAPALRSGVCPATGNTRSINTNYIRGGVNEFGNPLPSILKRAAYQGTRVQQLGINTLMEKPVGSG
jgi:hypothetical protein